MKARKAGKAGDVLQIRGGVILADTAEALGLLAFGVLGRFARGIKQGELSGYVTEACNLAKHAVEMLRSRAAAETRAKELQEPLTEYAVHNQSALEAAVKVCRQATQVMDKEAARVRAAVKSENWSEAHAQAREFLRSLLLLSGTLAELQADRAQCIAAAMREAAEEALAEQQEDEGKEAGNVPIH